MEAVEVGILRASLKWRQLKLRIADSLTVSSRLKLGADVTREAVQGRVNSKRRRFTNWDEAGDARLGGRERGMSSLGCCERAVEARRTRNEAASAYA